MTAVMISTSVGWLLQLKQVMPQKHSKQHVAGKIIAARILRNISLGSILSFLNTKYLWFLKVSVQLCNFLYITHLLSMYKWDYFKIKWYTRNKYLSQITLTIEIFRCRTRVWKKHLGLLLLLWRARISKLNTKIGLIFHLSLTFLFSTY